mmetsp:Transcript_11816/g.25620  ORF Transcript_11816/g.25620 Transcript_11816/m.25620 type:complete len:105 (-) Transcript_11816:3-317(-)
MIPTPHDMTKNGYAPLDTFYSAPENVDEVAALYALWSNVTTSAESTFEFAARRIITSETDPLPMTFASGCGSFCPRHAANNSLRNPPWLTTNTAPSSFWAATRV